MPTKEEEEEGGRGLEPMLGYDGITSWERAG